MSTIIIYSAAAAVTRKTSKLGLGLEPNKKNQQNSRAPNACKRCYEGELPPVEQSGQSMHP